MALLIAATMLVIAGHVVPSAPACVSGASVRLGARFSTPAIRFYR
jgi:hypothetical protein